MYKLQSYGSDSEYDIYVIKSGVITVCKREYNLAMRYFI